MKFRLGDLSYYSHIAASSSPTTFVFTSAMNRRRRNSLSAVMMTISSCFCKRICVFGCNKASLTCGNVGPILGCCQWQTVTTEENQNQLCVRLLCVDLLMIKTQIQIQARLANRWFYSTTLLFICLPPLNWAFVSDCQTKLVKLWLVSLITMWLLSHPAVYTVWGCVWSASKLAKRLLKLMSSSNTSSIYCYSHEQVLKCQSCHLLQSSHTWPENYTWRLWAL